MILDAIIGVLLGRRLAKRSAVKAVTAYNFTYVFAAFYNIWV